MNEEYTPERLLTAVARRDSDAFKRLYTLASPKLFAITLRVCRDKSLAEDALQETFTAIWRRASAFNPRRGTGMVWMSAIARNRAMDALNRQRGDTRIQTGVYEEETARIPDLEGPRADYAELDALLRCLDQLNETQRESVLLSYYGGWSRDTLARHFATPESNVKIRLREGFAKLRVALERVG